MSRRGALVVVGIVVALVVILVLSNPRTDPYERPPLDPRGTGPQGMRGLVELLTSVGAEVEVGTLPRSSDQVVFQASDTVSGSASDRILTWVRDGGTLVTADPFGRFSAPLDDGLSFDPLQPDFPVVCTIDALAEVGSIPESPLRYEVGRDDSSCFGDGATAAVTIRSEGDGMVVSLPGEEVFTNERLDQADTAVMAVALLAHTEGLRVRILDPTRYVSDSEDEGDGTVLGALPRRGRQAVGQVLVAFLVWGLVRGRRLGKPVPEELPVPVPGSELVLAVAEMLARGDDVPAAAERLRRRVRRRLGVTTGLGPDPQPDLLLHALHPHTTLDPDRVRRALYDPVPTVDALLVVVADLDHLQEDLHGTHAPT